MSHQLRGQAICIQRYQMGSSPQKSNGTWVANSIFVIYAHIIGFAAIIGYRPPIQTVILGLLIWFLAGIGITRRFDIYSRDHNGVSQALVTSIVRGKLMAKDNSRSSWNHELPRIDQMVGRET